MKNIPIKNIVLVSLIFFFTVSIQAQETSSILPIEDSISEQNCKESLNVMIQQVDAAITNGVKSKVGEKIRDEVERSWQSRVVLNQKNNILWSGECKQKLRKYISLAREYEELFINEGKENVYPDLLINNSIVGNKKVRSVEEIVKPGDIIVRRGLKMESAIVSNMTEVPGRFSHLSLVDHDGVQVRVLEVNPTGLVYQKWDQYIEKNESAHLAVYRLKENSDFLGKRAAQNLRAKVGKLKYNYSGIVREGEERMFCSESVSFAYRSASVGKLVVPETLSNVGKFFQTPFAKKIGLKTDQTFFPSDIEIDSRFEIVFEERFVGKMLKVKRFDAVFNRIIDWVKNRNYQVSDKVSDRLVYIDLGIMLLKGIRKMGFLKEFTPDDVPNEMMLLLGQTFVISNRMLDFITEEDNSFREAHGYYMNSQQLNAKLDELRVTDCKLFLQNKKWKNSLEARSWPGVIARPPNEYALFHQQFNPFNEATDFSKISCD